MRIRRFDLLLLDILMPDLSGMDAAKEIRSSDCEIPIIFLTSSRDKQLTSFAQEEAYLALKTGSGIVKLLFSQKVYVEVTNRTIQFIIVNGEVREAYSYLSDYEDNLLSDPHFLSLTAPI